MNKTSRLISITSAAILLIAALGMGIFSIAGDKDSDGFLGVYIEDLSDELREALVYKGDGAFVQNVVDDSPAEKAGIEASDIIVKYGGKSVENASDLRKLIKKTKPGEEVELILVREGKEKSVTAKIGDMDDYQDFDFQYFFGPEFGDNFKKFIFKPKKYLSTHHHGFLGLHLQKMSDQLAEYFGVKRGALIGEVVEDSPAAKAGLKAGDVIIEFDGRRIDDKSDINHFIKKTEPGDIIEIIVMRKGKQKTFKVELGEPSEKASWLESDKKGLSKRMKCFEIEMESLDDELEDLDDKLKDIEIKIKKEAAN